MISTSHRRCCFVVVVVVVAAAAFFFFGGGGDKKLKRSLGFDSVVPGRLPCPASEDGLKNK